MAIDTESDDWREIEKWLNEVTERATRAVLSPSCDERRADYCRGLAGCANSLLSYARGEGAPDVPEPTDY